MNNMRGLVEDTKKLSLTHNNNNNKSNNSKDKLINNSRVNNKNNNMASSAIAKKNITSVPNPTIATTTTNTTTTTPAALRKTKARPKSTDCKMLQQQHQQSNNGAVTKQKQSPSSPKQQQRPKSSIITGTSYNLNNNNSIKSKKNQSQEATTISLPKASHANTNEEITGGVQDTIYLCNFRVSVDGEWLCLKELQDLDCNHSQSSQQQGKSVHASNNSVTRQASYAAWQKNKRYSGICSQGDENARDPAEIERSNLVNICKLIVKELLEQSLRYGRMLDSDHLPLQHFFIVIEHVLGHGLRTRKGLLGPRKELWDLLQSVENFCPEAVDITASVRDLPTVRTHIGRARAWLRIALMQKKLSDYLQALIEHRDEALFEYYEPHALMLSDEIVIIMGILVGLNVIDCNLCVKEEDLDSQQGVIDFSLYLRSSSRNNDTNEDEEETAQNNDSNGQGNMIAVLDQKNYIEELNRHLNATVANLQAKVESLTTTNALMKEDLAIARNSLLALQAENQAIRGSTGPASINSNHSDHSSQSEKKEEKEAMVILTAELADLKKRNTELEKELKLQISLKAESDMAMKLLEKDIHEKQDTIVSLRRQLDDIKQINLDMYRKLQECESSLAHKTELLSKLEIQKEDLAVTISQLEKKWSDEKTNLSEILKSTTHNSSMQLTALEERAARAETEARIEREWRLSLQSKEKKFKDNISDLQNCIKELTTNTQNHEKLKQELEKVKTQWSEAQTTLEELGVQLSDSKLKVNELQEREKRQQLKQQKLQQQQPQSPLQTSMDGPSIGIWAPDSIVTHCTSCRKEFNLTRRKHHCRSCGDIFCKSCSERTLPLLNEQGQLGKPVRVCDHCYATKN